MKYEWSDSAFIKISAAVAGKALERIRKQHDGKLEPQTVVDAARTERSPLHPAFEWDDFKAAESHRRETARRIIRSLRVVKGQNSSQKRVYLNVALDGSREYRTTADVRNDPALKARVLRMALAEMKAYRHRYNEIQELVSIADEAIDLLEEKLAKAS